jgi:hypothetical protein
MFSPLFVVPLGKEFSTRLANSDCESVAHCADEDDTATNERARIIKQVVKQFFTFSSPDAFFIVD